MARSDQEADESHIGLDTALGDPSPDLPSLYRSIVENNLFLPVPKEEVSFVGDGDFRRIGAEFLELFIRYGGLRPGSDVIDFGCGIGRMAIPLTQYLGADASYVGIDVNPHGIAWCRRRISKIYQNFKFLRVDYVNSLYNPKGKKTPQSYRLPLGPRSFDFAISTSVFTHLARHEMKAFVRQLASVLRPGGRLFATFFLLDEIAVEAMRSGGSRLSYQFDSTLNTFEAIGMPPRSATAFRRDYIETILRTSGFMLCGEIHRGSWSGVSDGLTYQDVIVAERVPHATKNDISDNKGTSKNRPFVGG